ncbi:ribose-5-phosphate isomerase RpiA [Roseiflexus sp.]|uniref:ribose-5-phosphate isomerase RpiA n=1 Tax=Roseiflexus sp. TaxID=2562120 RepID=UPI0021DE761F|nr:ribose-5-phosphate isomerase RpiA [Roseiflexus sp.]GIW02084.1 MAG: ribose-5-phosphate isomerase A [Roseiflexus sp.]
MDDHLYRRRAAERALDYVESGMAIGLGTGSTASFMLRGLAARLADGRLQRIVGVPTSEQTAALARELGIPLTTLDRHPSLDLALDGADEIDPHLRLIKGLGGAMLREKIVAASAARFVVMASVSKRVERLGERSPLPVEVVTFGMPLCIRRLAALGGEPVLRCDHSGAPFVTDEGNLILDCHFGVIADPEALAAAICAIPGVVAHGLFLGMASLAVIAGPDGIVELECPDASRR